MRVTSAGTGTAPGVASDLRLTSEGRQELLQENFSQRVEAFLTAAEEKRYQIATGRSPADLGRFFADASSLFSSSRIAEIQRLLAGSEGAEERQLRALLEFLAKGHARRAAAAASDQKHAWRSSGVVLVGQEGYPLRSISTTLRLTLQQKERHIIAAAYMEALGDHADLAEEFLRRYESGMSELGYGSHLNALQVLAEVDLEEMLREGARFLADTEGMYLELLDYHLPRAVGLRREEAVPADMLRVLDGSEYEALFTTGSLRGLGTLLIDAGVDHSAGGRIQYEWSPPDQGALASFRAIQIPDDLRILVAPAPGRMAAASFLYAQGRALHAAFTDPELSFEERRLGDEGVPLASGRLLEALLRSPSFMARRYDLPRTRIRDYLGLEVLCMLYKTRRDIGLLQFEAAFHDGSAGGDEYAQLLMEATGIQHDPRAALWEIDGEFASASRLRAAQLAAAHSATLTNRYDEDWFRNPASGGYLTDLFSNGRRYTARELAGQLGWPQLTFEPMLNELSGLVG